MEVAHPVAAIVRGPRRSARVLGVYQRAVYLQVGGRLLAVTAVDAERLPMGLHLQVASRPGQPLLGLGQGSSVAIGEGELTIVTDPVAFVARPVATWDPRPSATGDGDSARLQVRLDALEWLLTRQAAPESLAALSSRSPLAPATGAMAADWRHRARDLLALLVRALGQQDYRGVEAATGGLVGLGSGLTPAADDVLGGILAAGDFLARAFETDRRRWRAAGLIVRRAARGQTTPVSEALLACAATGAVGESAGTLLRALVARDPGMLAGALARTLALGHTSGADVALGILLGARLHLQALAGAAHARGEGTWW